MALAFDANDLFAFMQIGVTVSLGASQVDGLATSNLNAAMPMPLVNGCVGRDATPVNSLEVLVHCRLVFLD